MAVLPFVAWTLSVYVKRYGINGIGYLADVRVEEQRGGEGERPAERVASEARAGSPKGPGPPQRGQLVLLHYHAKVLYSNKIRRIIIYVIGSNEID